MADVLVINSSTITLSTFNATLDRLVPYVKGGIPELHFSRILPALAALPDAWSAKSVTLTMGGTLRFSGDVVGYVDRYHDEASWVREYRALGLRNRADYLPVTDSVTLTDTAVFNLPGDDPNFVGARAGLSVGQIVTQILTMTGNAVALFNAGIGAYTSMGPPTLPAATVTDLAALTVIPQWRVAISGERILQSLENFVQTCHPNHWLHVQPDGTIRFLDLRGTSANTLTLGGDPRLGMPSLTRDYSECFSQVEVRGNTIAVPMTLQTLPWQGSSSSDGGLQEAFAWNGFTNAQAKTNWTPASFNQPSINGDSNDFGTCTCTDTTHVVVTSHDNTATWAVNFWAQGTGEAQGQIYVYSDIIPGIGQLYAARIVANTALAAAGTSILTLDRPLPAVTYNSYQIWGLALNGSVVWRKYKVSNSNIASALLNFFPYPVPIRGANGTSAAMTSVPVAEIQWSNNGSPPYNTSAMGLTVDPVGGYIYLDRPSALVFGTQTTAPSNVIAFLPVANGSLAVYSPSSSTYGGTSFTVEGIQRTKVITVRDWKDYSNTSTMQTFASEFLDSVKDVVVEGTVPYFGLAASQYLAPGQNVSIAGSGYVTGYESLALPVVSAEVLFQSGPQGTSYMTTLQLSNRRGRFNSDNFLRPNVTGQQLGTASGFFGGATPNIAEGPTGPASNWSLGGAETWGVGGKDWSTALSLGDAPTGDAGNWNTSFSADQWTRSL
jgi:hypothetical protein